jgi:hypothetical protein
VPTPLGSAVADTVAWARRRYAGATGAAAA